MIRFNEDAVLKHFNPGEITDINFNTTEKKKETKPSAQKYWVSNKCGTSNCLRIHWIRIDAGSLVNCSLQSKGRSYPHDIWYHVKAKVFIHNTTHPSNVTQVT